MDFQSDLNCNFMIYASDKHEAQCIANEIARKIHGIISLHNKTGTQRNNWTVHESKNKQE